MIWKPFIIVAKEPNLHFMVYVPGWFFDTSAT